MKRTTLTFAAVLLLAGCGGSSDAGDTGSPSGSTAAAAQPAQPTTLPALAATIGCTGYADASADSPLTKTYGTCMMPSGNGVQLYEFADAETMATFWDSVKGFGSTPDQSATVGLLVAYPDAADLPAVKSALGQ